VTNSSPTIMVTGASGALGRRVVEILLSRKAGQVIAGAHDVENLSEIAASGAELRTVDFDGEPDALAASFAGVNHLLLVSTDDAAAPGRCFEQHDRAIRAAVKAGVEHVVYTSIAHPDAESPVLVALDHWRTEQALAQSGLRFTSLRNNLYTDDLLELLRSALAQGQLFGAAGEAGAAYVTREDCAKSAATAVATPAGDNMLLEVTGPAVVSYTQIARLVTELTGHRVTHVPLKPDDRRAELIGAGFSLPRADVMVSMDTGMTRGKFGPPTAVVRQLTGRAPTSVREFLLGHRKALTSASE